MVENNRFRRDLYYRLGVIRIKIPPLRKRPTDTLLLAEHFIEQICRRLGKPLVTLAPEVADVFLRYSWPGNIREMQNVLEGAIELASDGKITYDLISASLMQKNMDIPDVKGTGATVYDLEKQMILDYLEKYKYNKTKVASALGMSRRTLYRRLDQYKLSS
jgi:transcriptional regulator with PAS, ATPase and Fis domain